MAHKFDVETFLDDEGIGYSAASSGSELILDQCPGCGKSNKFYISVETGQFICHSCASSDDKMKGGAINLVMALADKTFREAKSIVLGREMVVPFEDDQISENLRLEFDENFYRARSKRFANAKELPLPIRLSRFMKALTAADFPIAYKYLLSRGVTHQAIQKLEAYVSTINSVTDAVETVAQGKSPQAKKDLTSLIYDVFRARVPITMEGLKPFLKSYEIPERYLITIVDVMLALKYKDRVIFTVRRDGLLYGWVARSFATPAKDAKTRHLKVLNSPGEFKYFCIWNLDQVREQSEIVICEGIVSAIKCGINRSVATLGKAITDEQIRQLKKTKAEKVYICLDVDAYEDMVKVKRSLLGAFEKVYRVKLPAVKVHDCPRCGMGRDINWNELAELTCQCGTTFTADQLREINNKTPFKDAGDYSEEEMQVFINSATEEDQDSFLFADSVFGD